MDEKSRIFRPGDELNYVLNGPPTVEPGRGTGSYDVTARLVELLLLLYFIIRWPPAAAVRTVLSTIIFIVITRRQVIEKERAKKNISWNAR